MRKGSEQNPNIEIENHRSLHDYIGRKNNDQLSERDKVIKSQFNLKLHDIQYFDCSLCTPLYDRMRIDPGELLILINKQYGFLWNTIPKNITSSKGLSLHNHDIRKRSGI